MNDKGIDEICESVYNCLYENTCLSNKKYRQLQKEIEPKKKHYLTLCKPSIHYANKKRILVQEGKGIGMLISSAVPFILELLKKVALK